jgi:hypothetical protein
MLGGVRFYLRAALALCVLLLSSAAAPGLAPPGALAAPAAGPVTFTVNSLTDHPADFTGEPNFDTCRTNVANTTCTLRAALMNANRHAGGAIIHLPAGLFALNVPPAGFYNDAGGSLLVSNTVTIVGLGAGVTVVDANNLYSAFVITPSVSVTLTSLTIQHGNGGAIDNQGQLTLSDSVLANNFGHEGGAIGNAGTAVINRSMLLNNIADKFGGAINNDYLGSVLTLNRSTLAGNRAVDGGAIDSGGMLTVFDSTLSNNSAVNSGGALHNYGTAHFYLSTVAGNLAGSGGTAQRGGGIYNDSLGAQVTLNGTLLAENYISSTVNECTGPIISQGYNFIQTTDGCSVTGDPTGNISNTFDPALAPLADNGGPTLTRLLPPGSPALGVIPLGLCQDQFGTAPVTDQRGVAPAGAKCNIGSVEGSQPRALWFQNTVFNGSAEAGAGSPSAAFVGMPGWAVKAGQFTVVPYNTPGGYPAVPTDTVPANHGANFLAGGVALTSIGYTYAFLAPFTDSLRANTTNFLLSADLGGFGTQLDNARVTAQFLNNTFSPIGPLVTIGPVSPAQRGSRTGFVHVSATGVVPGGSVVAEVDVIMERDPSCVGCYNDGYADNISLVLLPRNALFVPLLLK